MRVAWGTCIQAFLMLLVNAKQRPPRERTNCQLNRKQSDLNSFLWTIKRDPPSFFFGTIHVPYTRVWDFIPDNSKRAFEESSVVYFELDLTDPSTIADLARCQMLPRGGHLRDVLPADLYGRLKRHLEYVRLMLPSWMTPAQRGRGLYAEYLFNAMAGDWERKRPVWVMLMVNGLTEADVRSRGAPVLDLYLAQEAERTRKRTGAVETVEEQCHPLNGLSLSQVIFALNQTLLQQEKLREGAVVHVPYTTDDLIQHYNCGDLNAVIFNHDTSQVPNFNNASLPPNEHMAAQQIDSYFRRELIYKRNERMGLRVQALLENNPGKSFFFAFGAGHFLGNNTVIDVLRGEGYEVEHTPAGEPIYRDRPPRWPSFPFHGPPSTNEELEAPLIPELVLHEQQERPLEVEKGHHPPRKKLRGKPRKASGRQFSDLWVRLGGRSTEVPPTPPLVHVINGYITVQPHLHGYRRGSQDRMLVNSTPILSLSALSLSLTISTQIIILALC
ncbi:metalloprotease TIKI1 [Paramormyrops kingsleyae]|uniref:Metalloprotease TIKI n=1 Tax=Paramormyrops kingsleyae TaxID=1676925 RepID=A0A3B3QTC4_9TELE|nr:metalloprotease TIKI1 [Paramormyrops kingsleyae]